MNRSIALVLVALSAGAGVARADTADRLLLRDLDALTALIVALVNSY